MAALKFSERRQGDNESFESFVTDLKILVKDCGYQEEERMVRDAIVFRCKHPKVREKCLDLADELTCEKAIEIGRNHETNLSSLKKLASDKDPTVNALRKDKRPPWNRRQRSDKNKRKPPTEEIDDTKDCESKPRKPTDKCGRCGYDKAHKKCPAMGQQCGYCKKMNHYAKFCMTKQVHKLQEAVDSEQETEEDSDQEESEEDPSLFVYSVESSCVTEDEQFYEEVEVEGTRVRFQLDSGAKANLKPCGEVVLNTRYKDRVVDVKFFIVDPEVESVLSGNTCVNLGLLKRVYHLTTPKPPERRVELDDYPELFKGLGCLPGTYHIQLAEGATPVAHAPRKVPVPQREKVIEELKRMEKLGVIVRQEEPTEWVNSLVVVQKPNGAVRLCIDPRDLNAAMKRSHYPMKTVDEEATRLQGANTFSILDAKSGFWQLKLDEETMDQMVEDLDGVEVIMDDVIIAGDESTHDERLQKFLERASRKGLKLNKEKCKIRQKEVPYVGHLLTAEGLKIDPQKIKAIQEMPEPESKEDVKRLLGFIQFQSRYLPGLSTVDAPLRELEKSDVLFHWDHPQKESFKKIKELVSQAPVLQYYDVTKPVTIQCDASGKGLGAALLQDNKPVCYASRALTDTETRYAPIESEMLAVVFACRKFHQYIYGRSVVVETDHMPLQAISSKPLSQVPLRLQKMILNVRGYDVEIRYIPGCRQVLADTLSRASVQDDDCKAYEEFQEINVVLSVSDERCEEFQNETKRDPELLSVLTMVKNGWPDTKTEVPTEARPYWTFRDELAAADGLLFKGTRLIVPKVLTPEMLRQIHKSHLGIAKCRQRAREVLFWSGMSVEIEQMVTNCSVCADYAKKQPSEPLKPSVPPSLPWKKIGTDLFEFRGEHYLLSVCYRSKFLEVAKLESLRSGAVIEELKRQFGVHGIPAEVVSDNGSQFSSMEFQDFAKDYGFKHTTTSPHYPQANVEVERAVQTVKKLWRKNDDKHLALLDYRTTPLPDIELSPAQLLMGRRLRNKLPMKESLLQPASNDQYKVSRYLEKTKEIQKKYHDRHASKDLKELQPGTKVRMQPWTAAKEWKPATVVQHHHTPRSYVVQGENGRKYRRNRQHLRVCPAPGHASLDAELSLAADHTVVQNKELPREEPDQTTIAPAPPDITSPEPHPEPTKENSAGPYVTRSGRPVVKPNRLDL
ncbi:hypothetical protein ACROYT_G037161 [Oculina patagonica]